MPRPRRIRQFEFPYSVTTRCNNKEFHLDQQLAYEVITAAIQTLKSRPKSKSDPTPKYQFEAHHLVVMSNHYHLVVSVSAQTPIDRFMQQLNSIVARAMNKLLNRSGHFWGERFKCRILDTMDFLSRTIAYVYRNPIRAKMTEDILSYAKSTLKAYWTHCLPSWLTPDVVMKPLSPPDIMKFLDHLVIHPTKA